MIPRDKSYDERWNTIWKAGLEPGQAFDASATSPALLAVIEQGKLEVRGKKVLVPGCGRGYDVIEFAKQGALSVKGMELVPEAAAAAQAYVNQSELDHIQRERTEIVTGDFFEITAQHAYDIGYDYTFFCAMEPVMRKKWAQAWSSWLQPGGELVTLMFPVEAEGREGPPWPVPVQLYDDTLKLEGLCILPGDCQHDTAFTE
ncbi:TPA: hypothetical protein ACH3X1_002954 [Trebouxia sp. C0004]